MSRAPGPTLTTERLILRPPDLADVRPWSEFMGDDASSFIGGPIPLLRGWSSLMSGAGEWAVSGYGMFSVVERACGEFIGRVGPLRPEGWPGNEVGWAIFPSAQGKGYAFEAAVAAMEWTIETLGWTDVIHTIHPDNFISQRLAKKLGSINTGVGKLPPPNEDHSVDIWRQTAAQWRDNRLRLTA
jgi:RimJ/RimL family protein N-acetyltransferase